MLFVLLAVFACSESSDTGEESASKGGTYREVTEVIPESGVVEFSDLGAVYIPMLCLAGDMGGCYPAVPGADYVVRMGAMIAHGEPGDVFVVGYFVR